MTAAAFAAALVDYNAALLVAQEEIEAPDRPSWSSGANSAFVQDDGSLGVTLGTQLSAVDAQALGSFLAAAYP